MSEPVSVAFSSLTLFAPIFQTGKSIYEGWKLMEALPRDMNHLSLQLEVFYDIFRHKAELKIDELRIHIDPKDENHRQTRLVLQQLCVIVDLFRQCDKIIKQNGPRDPRRRLHKSPPKLEEAPPEDNSITLQNSRASESPTSTQRSSERGILEREKAPPRKWFHFRTRKDKSSKVDPISEKRDHRKHRRQNEPSLEGSTEKSRELDVPGIAEEQEVRKERIRKLAQTDLARRAGWAIGGKKELEEVIKRIRSALDTLEQYLQVKQTESIANLMPEIRAAATREIQKTGRTQMRVLNELHESLRHINIDGKPCGPYALAIKVQEDPEESRHDLGELGQPLRDSSSIFVLQRHERTDESKFVTLAVETYNCFKRGPNPLECIAEPSETRAFQEDAVTALNIDEWGQCYFPGAAASPSRASSIFHIKGLSWLSSQTLSDIVQSEEYRNKVTAPQVFHLARSLAVAYLYFALVRSSCGNPRLQNFRYYDDGSSGFKWNTSSPLVLQPWLFFGFGSRVRKRQFGTGSGTSQANNSSLVELGLLLYQIATRGTDIEPGAGPEAVKAQAIRNMNKVTKLLGGSYTRIVRACLEHRGPDEYIPKASAVLERDSRKLEEVIAALLAGGQALEDDQNPALCFATFSEDATVVPTQASAPDREAASRISEATAGTVDEETKPIGSSRPTLEQQMELHAARSEQKDPHRRNSA